MSTSTIHSNNHGLIDNSFDLHLHDGMVPQERSHIIYVKSSHSQGLSMLKPDLCMMTSERDTLLMTIRLLKKQLKQESDENYNSKETVKIITQVTDL